jgi:hypothetical protein
MELLRQVTEADFVSDYGNYANKFALVNADGGISFGGILPYVVLFLLLIGIVFMLDRYNKMEDKEKQKFKGKMYYYVFLFGVMLSIVVLLSGIANSISYNGQFKKWYDSLPAGGRKDYDRMKMVDIITQSMLVD